MDHILQLHEFFVEGQNPTRSHVLLHITEPSTDEEKKKGYFFAICEINQGSTEFIEEIQKIIEQIENNYYESGNGDNEKCLEDVLENINREHIGLLSGAGKLTCLVGVIYNNQIIFSFHGKPIGLLFYKNRKGLYQKMDLCAPNQNTDIEKENDQLFSQLIQGKISLDDFLFIATPQLGEYFNADRLEKIITTRTTRQSAEHLRRTLNELKNEFSYGGLIIHLNKINEAGLIKKSFPKNPGDSVESLSRFFNTEQNTAQTLSASLLPGVNKKIKQLLCQIKRTAAWPREKPEPFSTEPESVFPTQINSNHLHSHRRNDVEPVGIPWAGYAMWAGTLLRGATRLAARGAGLVAVLVSTLLISAGRGMVMLFFVATNYQNRRRNILENWSRQWRNVKENIRYLPASTKLLALGSLLFLILFIGGVSYLKIQQRRAETAQTFTSKIAEIKIKKDNAEGALLYKNEATAFLELQSAMETLNSLDCSNKDAETICVKLRSELENLLQGVRKMDTAATILVASWKNELPFSHVVRIGNSLLAYSPETSQIGIYDLLTKDKKTINPQYAVSGFVTSAVPKENDYVLLLATNGEWVQFNPVDQSFKKIEVSFPIEQADISAALVYNRRLYTLDRSNNQIYRHDVTRTGFTRGQVWLKDAAAINIKSGVGLAIDGDIFVLLSSGGVIKLNAGIIQKFELQNVDPNLRQADRIWTYNDMAYLYILDTNTKRLLIFTKEGRLHRQVTSPDFSAPSDMIIDETHKAAFIIDQGELKQLALPL